MVTDDPCCSCEYPCRGNEVLRGHALVWQMCLRNELTRPKENSGCPVLNEQPKRPRRFDARGPGDLEGLEKNAWRERAWIYAGIIYWSCAIHLEALLH